MMASLKQDAKRAAQLLNSQELAGWDLAELCARRILSSNDPKEVEFQRELGRVSASEWAEMVTGSGRRRMATTTAKTYARCWRRYGENRLHDEKKNERPFVEHLKAAEGSEDQAEENIARFQNRDKGTWGQGTQVAQQTIAEQAERLPAGHKAALARQFLADPVVAEQAMRDDTTAVNVAAARGKHVQERNERQDEAARIRAPELYQAGDIAEVGNNLAHISSRLELLASQLQKIPADKRGQFTRLWDEVKRYISWVEAVMAGESMDEGLQRLLEGGDQR